MFSKTNLLASGFWNFYQAKINMFLVYNDLAFVQTTNLKLQAISLFYKSEKISNPDKKNQGIQHHYQYLLKNDSDSLLILQQPKTNCSCFVARIHVGNRCCLMEKHFLSTVLF